MTSSPTPPRMRFSLKLATGGISVERGGPVGRLGARTVVSGDLPQGIVVGLRDSDARFGPYRGIGVLRV